MCLNTCWFVLQSDLKLKKFLHIIDNFPVFPVIYDNKRYYNFRLWGSNTLSSFISDNVKVYNELYLIAMRKLHVLKEPFFFFLFFHSVATYPSAGGQRGAHGCIFHGRKMLEVATNVYSRKMSENPEKAWSTNFKCERFGSCIYAWGRY